MALVKLVFRRDYGQLLGVHIVGGIAGALIHLRQSVVHAGDTIDRFHQHDVRRPDSH